MGKRKSKFDNARKINGMYFIDADDRTYSEILKKRKKKLEKPVSPAMPCKRMEKEHLSITKVMQNNCKEKEFKTMYGCILEYHESTRQRADSL